MSIQLDHAIVPSHSQVASAKLLAQLLDVPWAETSVGPFVPVYINDGLTLDFQETDEVFPVYHFCFRVSPQDFDAILGRIKAAGIEYRSTVHGPGRYAGRSAVRKRLLERTRRSSVGDANRQLRAAGQVSLLLHEAGQQRATTSGT